MPRSSDDEFFWPAIGGTGSLHDLSDHETPLPRLYGMKSVSKKAAFALQDRPNRSQRVAGFVHGRAKG